MSLHKSKKKLAKSVFFLNSFQSYILVRADFLFSFGRSMLRPLDLASI